MPGHVRRAPAVRNADAGVGLSGRELFVDVVVAVQGDGLLLEIIEALGAIGGFAHLLHGGHQERDQNGDDGDDDQEFNERESAASSNRRCGKHGISPIKVNSREKLRN